MFTGIIQEIGKIIDLRPEGGGIHLAVAAPRHLAGLAVNDSVALNGVCLTVIAKSIEAFETVAVEETLRKTALKSLRTGSEVNLELPMKLDDRLGGHLVLGHVDTVGRIAAREALETSWLFTIDIPPEFYRLVVPTGSIAIDGVSLTIARLEGTTVGISIIPHTMDNTIFHRYQIGDEVNVEFDLIGKYVERLMAGERQQGERTPPLTEQYLRTLGY